MSRSLALFDFDGTITRSDTLLDFMSFAKGRLSFGLGMIILSPILVLYKLKLIPNWRAKEMVLSYFFKGMPEHQFHQLCESFAREIIPGLIRPKAKEELERHRREGNRVVIVSASAENWIQPWASQINIELIATRLQIIDGKMTGRFVGKNCFGEEKVARVNQFLVLSDYPTIETYSDSRSDQPLLDLGTRKHFKPFMNE